MEKSLTLYSNQRSRGLERIDDTEVLTSLGKFENLQLSTTELMRKYPQPSRAEREAMLEARSSDAPLEPPRDRRGHVLRELWEAKLLSGGPFRTTAPGGHDRLLVQPLQCLCAKEPEHAFDSSVLRARRDTALRIGPLRGFAYGDGRASGDAFLSRQLGEYERRFRPAGGTARPARTSRWAGRDVDEKASRSSGINENYARELMELHTLGVDGGYEQKDVVEVARALTGWSVVGPQAVRVKERIEERMGRTRMPEALRALPDEGRFFFNELAHDDGVKTNKHERDGPRQPNSPRARLVPSACATVRSPS